MTLRSDGRNFQALEAMCVDMIEFLDPEWTGNEDTPHRWAGWLWDMFFGPRDDNMDSTFEAVHTDQMIAVSGITTWSLCEHHVLPFSTDLAVGYLSHDRIIGASKLVRIATEAARGLQVQERLCHQTADGLAEILGHEDVAVVADGQHLCMQMRGVKQPATLHTSIMRGAFGQNADTRAEFMTLIGR
jgi:GTP cyclohydrolase IA